MDVDHALNPVSNVRAATGILAAAVALSLLAACGNRNGEAAVDAARAQSLLEQHRIGEARRAIAEAISANDDEPAIYLLKGRIEFAAGAIANAFDAYQNALGLDRTNAEALQAVSQLGLQTGHLRESLAATESLLVLDPKDTAALVTRGLHAIVQRQYDEAGGYADRILAVDPANEGGAILKARVAFLRGDTANALVVLDEFSAAKPDTAGIALTRLEVSRERRDAAAMARQFVALRTLVPDDRALRLDEANFLFKTGRPVEAIALVAAQLADLKVPPNIVKSAIDLWRNYAVVDLPEDELRRIAKGGSPQARLSTADYLIDLGKLAAARLMVDGLAGVDRQAVEARLALAEGQADRASSLVDGVLAVDVTNCAALSVRAQAQLDRRNPRSALRSAQQAAAQCPETIAAWSRAAQAYTALDDSENARRMYRQGLAANPQSVEIAKQFVDWLARRGAEDEAVAVARRLTFDAPALSSGWQLYLSTCRHFADPCVGSAGRGLADARTRYGIDLLPGESPPNGLFGRLVAR